jgi:hypothetical protein
MLYNCFLKGGIVYVPTVVKMQSGVYSDEEPVSVIRAENTEGLRRAFLDTVSRKNVVIPNPPKDNWPPPILLKYSGAKTWSSFARGTITWSIKEDNGNYKIVGYRTHRDGYWVEDPEHKIEFPSQTSVDTVVDRMIAIIQKAASQRRPA